MGKETATEKEKGHDEHKDAHAAQEDAHQASKNLDAQGKHAVSKVVGGEHANTGEHKEGAHDEHAKGEHAALGPIEQAMAQSISVKYGIPLAKCEEMMGKVVHWSHSYSHAFHNWHIALEGVETFLHILAEYHVSEELAEFFHGAGGGWVGGILKGLAIPIVFAHATEYGDKAIAAFKEGNSTAGIYYSMQAVFTAGSMAKVPAISWMCTFMNQMLQVSEGKGMVHDFAMKMQGWADQRKATIDNADLSFVNHSSAFQKVYDNLGGDGSDRRSSSLEFLSTGYKSREAALKAIKDLREQNMIGQDDYAITNIGGVYTVCALGTINLFAADIDNKRELESVFIGHDNRNHIDAVVAEDGTWGEVIQEPHEDRKRDGTVTKWNTYSVVAVGRV